ncbi:hypothetical protein MJD09_17065 [bacterium]|nr:hypothetical protein [bacterium]
MSFRSHLIPSTRRGKTVTIFIVCLYLLIQWPILSLVNRMHPFILGMPFLYFYLLVIYFCIIGVMIYACRKEV